MKDVSLYVHIPFCKAKCSYCDFYSIDYDAQLVENCVDVISSQIQSNRIKFNYKTVYFGGGTPSILNCNQLEKLFRSTQSQEGIEYTVEVNPESLTVEKLELMKQCKINRLSIGVQSFNDDVLGFLGRVHSAKKAENSVYMAQSNDIDNISIDLIYAVPGKTFDMWKHELAKVCELGVKHVSLYSLTYERATPMYKDLAKSKFVAVSDSDDAKMYIYAQDFLIDNGFIQYEISNFAKPDFYSRHNNNYWQNNEYLGIGPGAVEYIDGTRRRNISDVKKYIDNYRQKEEVFEEAETLQSQEYALETAILNLRSIGGINFDLFLKKTGYDIQKLKKEEINKLVQQDLIENFDGGLRLSKKGFRFYDHIARQML